MFPIRPGPDRPYVITASWKSGFISLFFPEKCPFCRTLVSSAGHSLPGLCPTCSEDIHWITPPFCPRCGRPFPAGTDSHLCPACLQDRLFFDWGRAAVFYQGVVARAVQRFKYQGDIKLALPLGRFWNHIDLQDLDFDTIVPVPLHTTRLRERGFNQAVLLGRQLGKIHRKRVSAKALSRIRNTRPQVDLDPSDRVRNVRGAFAAREPETIRGKKLLLVDDVFTTGATVNECAKVLKKTGAKEVFVLTLSRVGVE